MGHNVFYLLFFYNLFFLFFLSEFCLILTFLYIYNVIIPEQFTAIGPPSFICWPTCSLCCIAYCLHWLPQRPSAATNSEGSHSVRLLLLTNNDNYKVHNYNYVFTTPINIFMTPINSYRRSLIGQFDQLEYIKYKWTNPVKVHASNSWRQFMRNLRIIAFN